MYIKKMNYEELNEFYLTDEYGFPKTDILSMLRHRYIKYEDVVPVNEAWNLHQNKFDLYLSAGLISVLNVEDDEEYNELISVIDIPGFYTDGKLVYLTHSKLKIITHPCDENLAWVPPIVFTYPGTLFSEDDGAASGRMNWMDTTFALFTTLIHGYKLSSSILYQKISEFLENDDDDYDEYDLAAEYGWDIDGLIALYDGIIKSGNQRLIDMLFKKNHELDIKIYAVIFDYLTNNNLANMTLLWPREIYEELVMFYNSTGEFEKQLMLMEANRNRPHADWSL